MVVESLTPGYTPLRVDPSRRPLLLVVVDTEEEFDWSAPFDRRNVQVRAMARADSGQAACDEFGIRPTYVIDHPVAANPEGHELLARFQAEGRCTIGAHLHPWVSPPFDEEVCTRNSYPGNLSAALEREKLARLLDTIEGNLERRPTIYKAGRYGLGSNSATTLAELGIEIDLSVCPPFDFRADGGPDYSAYDSRPFRFGPAGALLELPATGGFVGWAGKARRGLYHIATRRGPTRARLPGVLAACGAVERIMLSPEGHGFEDLRRLTLALLARGERVFSFTFHSPTLLPGCTPYVRNDADLRAFLACCRRYFRFFLDELHGEPTTPHEAAAILAVDATQLPS